MNKSIIRFCRIRLCIFPVFLFFLFPTICLSQSPKKLEKNGLIFECNVYTSSFKKTGADGAEYPVIKTGAFNCRCVGGEFTYAGKKYSMNSFDGQLSSSFQQVTVQSLQIRGTFPNTILEGPARVDACFKPYKEIGNSLRSLKKGTPLDGNIEILDICSISNTNSIVQKINELEKLKSDADINKKQKEELAKQKEIEENKNLQMNSYYNTINQNNASNSSDYWYRDTKDNKNVSNNTTTVNTKSEQERLERERKLQELNHQMAQIEQNRQNLNQATNETTAQWASGNYIEGSKALAMELAKQGNVDGAYGTIAVGTALQIFSVLGQNKKEKEEKERQLELERLAKEEENRRKLALEKQEEERRMLLASTRKEILNLFITKPYPNSLTNIETNKIYYFIYTKINDFKEENITIQTSNVFAVGKYPDGTWPMQKSILNDLTKVIPNQEPVFCGYFTSETDAELAWNDFIKNLSRVNITVNPFVFNGKNSDVEDKTEGNKVSEIDFWGNPIKNDSQTENQKEIDTKSKPKLDFWGNPIKD